MDVLAQAQKQTERLMSHLAEKDEELNRLKVENHELPSRILKLQSELDEEKNKFRKLAERFNSVKELELHRQKQKFMAVSKKQKEVFLKV